jgi:FKBP-type peptidyl-prolyl cis-trans isomerase
MKSQRLLAALAAAGLLAACAKNDGAGGSSNVDLDTDAQKFGYAIGVDLGKSLTPVKDQVDIAALKAGLDDQFSRGESKMDDAAREAIKTTVAKAMQEKQMQERTEKAAKAKEEGAKFLAENGKREGVKTTASGLQYEVLSDAQGEKPKASDKVTVHYKGTLINGEEFDSSYSRNQPVTFPLANVIPGWTEGLQLMPVGSKYKFYIPSELGYGERGAGVKIGPNATLVFEVELIAIAKDEAPKADKKAEAKK